MGIPKLTLRDPKKPHIPKSYAPDVILGACMRKEATAEDKTEVGECKNSQKLSNRTSQRAAIMCGFMEMSIGTELLRVR